MARVEDLVRVLTEIPLVFLAARRGWRFRAQRVRTARPARHPRRIARCRTRRGCPRRSTGRPRALWLGVVRGAAGAVSRVAARCRRVARGARPPRRSASRWRRSFSSPRDGERNAKLLDDLALHLDLIALAMEAGSSLPAALAICAERAPDGALRRALSRVSARDSRRRRTARGIARARAARRAQAAELAGGGAALGGATERRTRRRCCASARGSPRGHRFARAERLARAAPLKLWAALVLCHRAVHAAWCWRFRWRSCWRCVDRTSSFWLRSRAGA